jgi:hypothetical protein
MANQAIIQAAGAAYKPVQGQYDISGFVNGVAAVAQGLVARQKLIGARESSADKLYLKTDNKIIQAKVLNIKEQYKNFNITEKEYQAEILKVKNDILTVEKINKRLVDVNKEGLALNAGPVEENYFLGLKDGSLTDNAAVKINTKFGSYDFSTFFEYNKDGVLTGMDPEGMMVPLDQLLAVAEKMPTKNLKEKYNRAVRGWQKEIFKAGTESKWSSKKNEFTSLVVDDLFGNGENKNIMYTSLIDNNLGFDFTNANDVTKNFNWHDFYTKEGLTEEQFAKYEKTLNGYDKDVREKAKGIVLKQMMDEDNNLMADVRKFLNQMIEYKKPIKETIVPIVSDPTAFSGFEVKGKLNRTDSKALAIISSLETAIDEAFETEANVGEVATTAKGGKIQLVRDEDEDGDKVYYFRRNLEGETNSQGQPLPEKRLGPNFILDVSREGYKKLMLKVIQEAGVPFGGETSIYGQYKYYLENTEF